MGLGFGVQEFGVLGLRSRWLTLRAQQQKGFRVQEFGVRGLGFKLEFRISLGFGVQGSGFS